MQSGISNTSHWKFIFTVEIVPIAFPLVTVRKVHLSKFKWKDNDFVHCITMVLVQNVKQSCRFCFVVKDIQSSFKIKPCYNVLINFSLLQYVEFCHITRCRGRGNLHNAVLTVAGVPCSHCCLLETVWQFLTVRRLAPPHAHRAGGGAIW